MTSKLITKKIFLEAAKDSFSKLSPRKQLRNPVMFVLYVGSILSTFFVFQNFISGTDFWFSLQLSVWLWFTVLFANFAEAVAEGRGKAQAASLKSANKEVLANKINQIDFNSESKIVSSTSLLPKDLVLVKAGELIPVDGEVVLGAASVDESAITGESAPVIRESGGDRSAVTGGTKVLSDQIIVRITCKPGQGFIDRMISLVEGASRHKTPNEIALGILLAGLTAIFLIVTYTIYPFMEYSKSGGPGIEPITLIALLICLIPTTIGGLLSAIGIAGMDRLIQQNVIALSGRSVEAAGDVNVLLLDKTGTITLGSRQASEFIPAPDCDLDELAEVAQLSSLSDETPEGRSIVVLAKVLCNKRAENYDHIRSELIPFSASTRMSGVDFPNMKIRKGAFDAISKFISSNGAVVPEAVRLTVEQSARRGETPLAVAKNNRLLGIICLKDTLKTGIKEKFLELRNIGIKTIMITGDNPLTAAAIAVEAGVDDFIAEATPEMKLEIIRNYQKEGYLVAMTGDGTNDAPALAQADVAVAMNTGTQAAKEAGNMIDLDSNPTKLIQIVEIGKQLLITRGSLTTFSIANDVSKYFAIIPAIFTPVYPVLSQLNILGLASPKSAILSAVIFNALVIPALIPLALRGVSSKSKSALELLRQNVFIYGLGGMIFPFIAIYIIDLVINFIGII